MNMAGFNPILHLLTDAAACLLIASVWQGAVLVAAVALCLRWVRGLSSAMRAGIWAGSLLCVVLLPILSFLVPHSGRAAGIAIHVPQVWSLALGGIWVGLSGVRAFGLARSAAHLHRVSSTAVPVSADGAVGELLTHGSRAVLLCTSAVIQRPCAAGFLQPRILLPARLFKTLSAAELEQIVRHEMEHLRRRDNWTNLLQQASLVLFPLNPAIAWADRRLAAERELACDDAVLKATGAHKAYAACLARIAEHAMVSRGIALTVALVGRRGRRPEISRRIDRILAAPMPAMSVRRTRLTLVLLSLCSVLAAAAIVSSPRLVSFHPAAGLLTAPVQAASNAAPTMAYMGSGPRPELVRAVMPSGSSPRLLRAPLATKHRVRRLSPMRQVAFSTSPLVVMTPWQERPQPVARQTLASYKLSQPQYAAIRFADGWLIVQL